MEGNGPVESGWRTEREGWPIRGGEPEANLLGVWPPFGGGSTAGFWSQAPPPDWSARERSRLPLSAGPLPEPGQIDQRPALGGGSAIASFPPGGPIIEQGVPAGRKLAPNGRGRRRPGHAGPLCDPVLGVCLVRPGVRLTVSRRTSPRRSHKDGWCLLAPCRSSSVLERSPAHQLTPVHLSVILCPLASVDSLRSYVTEWPLGAPAPLLACCARKRRRVWHTVTPLHLLLACCASQRRRVWHTVTPLHLLLACSARQRRPIWHTSTPFPPAERQRIARRRAIAARTRAS